MTWNLVSAVIYVLLLNLTGLFLFWRGRVGVLRAVMAGVVLAIFQYGCLFALDGFGWGWADPGSTRVTFLRLTAGIVTAVGCFLFLLIATKTAKVSAFCALSWFFPLVYLINTGKHLPYFLTGEAVAILVSSLLVSRRTKDAVIPRQSFG